jgi:hypothetical protein
MGLPLTGFGHPFDSIILCWISSGLSNTRSVAIHGVRPPLGPAPLWETQGLFLQASKWGCLPLGLYNPGPRPSLIILAPRVPAHVLALAGALPSGLISHAPPPPPQLPDFKIHWFTLTGLGHPWASTVMS